MYERILQVAVFSLCMSLRGDHYCTPLSWPMGSNISNRVPLFPLIREIASIKYEGCANPQRGKRACNAETSKIQMQTENRNVMSADEAHAPPVIGTHMHAVTYTYLYTTNITAPPTPFNSLRMANIVYSASTFKFCPLLQTSNEWTTML